MIGALIADLLKDLLDGIEVRNANDDGPPIRPIREDREQPGGEMPRPSGTSSPVAVGCYDEIHPEQVIEV